MKIFTISVPVLLERYSINNKQVCSGAKCASFLWLPCAQLGYLHAQMCRGIEMPRRTSSPLPVSSHVLTPLYVKAIA